MTDDSVSWLMRWYLDQCDGDWELYGIDIGNLDNRLTLKVDLRDTVLEGRPFTRSSMVSPPTTSKNGSGQAVGGWLTKTIA